MDDEDEGVLMVSLRAPENSGGAAEDDEGEPSTGLGNGEEAAGDGDGDGAGDPTGAVSVGAAAG